MQISCAGREGDKVARQLSEFDAMLLLRALHEVKLQSTLTSNWHRLNHFHRFNTRLVGPGAVEHVQFYKEG